MMLASRAASNKANILFDTGASANFVSKAFAKQTGIAVRPVEYSVRLANDKTIEVAREATMYVQLGSFHKHMKCYVMDMLYEVDLILGKSFMDDYDRILHYGNGCIMIQKGKRHKTMNTPGGPAGWSGWADINGAGDKAVTEATTGGTEPDSTGRITARNIRASFRAFRSTAR
jgi:hypothetical protein